MTEILISSTLLIGVILLLRALLRNRVSHRLQYALWLLVALRLLIPVQFGQSQYSVATLTQQAAQTPPVQQFQQTLDKPIAGPSRVELYEQLLHEYLEEAAPEQQTVPVQIQTQLQQEVQKQTIAPSPAQILTIIWICGASAMGLWFLITNIIFLRRAKQDATPCPNHWAPIPVRICPNVPTPCLVGLIRPKICLTPSSAEEVTRNHVLTHEITHLRHWDHIWSWVRCLCLCLYWFHPLVWVAAILSRRDCELACDEGALKRLGEQERIPYGKTLLATVAQSPSPAHLLETATAMNESKRQLKERVEAIVKKPRNLLIAAISMILVIALAAGCAFSGVKPTEPTSAHPQIENSQVLIDLAHEAEEIVANNQTITLDSHEYVTEYIRYNSDKFTLAATVTDDTVTLNREHIQQRFPLDDGSVITHVIADLTLDFQYLTFLDLLMDRYADAVTPIDIHYDITFNRLYNPTLFFYPQYREAGYDTVAACYAAIDSGTFSIPEYSFYIRYDTPSIHWANDPSKPLEEEPTDPPETTRPTETEPSNTEGPPLDPPVSPADAAHLFSDPTGWYAMALTSLYSTPEQVDLAAFFADGFPYESSTPTQEEWALLKDVEGFRQDGSFRRMSADAMDEVLIQVFGIGLSQMEGVGLDRLTYLEETDCYYFMSTGSQPPQILVGSSTPTSLRFTDEHGITHYVNLDVTGENGNYHYTITSHLIKDSDRVASNMRLAQEYLGVGYAEYLYLSNLLVDKHLTTHCNVSPEIRQQVATDTIAISERSLFLSGDTLMLRFRYLSLAAPDDPMRDIHTAKFDLNYWELANIPDHANLPALEPASYRWLFDLAYHTDGAYTDSYYILVADTLFSDPESFIRHLTLCSGNQIDDIARYLPLTGLNSEDLVLYENLLQALSTDTDLTDQERATAQRMLQLFSGETQEPEVPYDIQHAIACYAAYRAIGTYCYRELNTEDMSRYLTDAQKEIYCQQQMQILCCGTPEEMLEHAHSLLDDSLLTEDPTDLLFTDYEGNLYLIITPMGMVNYHHIQQVGSNIYYAGAYDESGYLYTVSFTFSSDGKLKEVLPLDANASEIPQNFRYLTFYLNDFFTVNKTDDTLTFSNGIIEGSVIHSTDGQHWKSSQHYAQYLLDSQGSGYPNRWIGNHEQNIYYTVFMDDQTTIVQAAYVYGDNVWFFTVQSATSAGRLAQMIHIATSGIL